MFLLLLLFLFLLLFFILSWLPGSTLLLVLGGAQVLRQDYWLEWWSFPGYCHCCCWCCCWFGCCLMTFVGMFWQDDPVVSRTSRVTSFPPRPPSSAGPDRLIYEEWPESPPYWCRYPGRSHRKHQVHHYYFLYVTISIKLHRDSNPLGACGFQKLLEGVFPYSRQSPIPQVHDYVGQSLWFVFRN